MAGAGVGTGTGAGSEPPPPPPHDDKKTVLKIKDKTLATNLSMALWLEYV